MKHWQDHEVEFRRDSTFDDRTKKSEYPDVRGLVVHAYGGTAEEVISKAREKLGLDGNWKVVRVEMAK